VKANGISKKGVPRTSVGKFEKPECVGSSRGESPTKKKPVLLPILKEKEDIGIHNEGCSRLVNQHGEGGGPNAAADNEKEEGWEDVKGMTVGRNSGGFNIATVGLEGVGHSGGGSLEFWCSFLWREVGRSNQNLQTLGGNKPSRLWGGGGRTMVSLSLGVVSPSE